MHTAVQGAFKLLLEQSTLRSKDRDAFALLDMILAVVFHLFHLGVAGDELGQAAFHVRGWCRRCCD